jgi:sulfate transport system ATP-binding protein
MGIVVSGVGKRFADVPALANVSIEVPDGSLTALLGPSGSGKSTLLRVIAGLEHPDVGSVHIAGRDVTDVPPQQRGVGFVFQHYAAFKHMTVRDNVGFGMRIRKRPKAEIRRRVDELLSLVQLEGLAERYPSQLSGGQRQRMALARALAIEPRVLLLDEPFGALDARVREELRAWLRRLHERVPVTTVLVTHDQEEAMEVASQVVVMNKGGVEQVGTPLELYRQPATPFVMGFVGRVNRLGETFIRPHEVELVPLVNGHGERAVAAIERVVHLGAEARVELVLDDGRALWAHVPAGQADNLALRQGERVGVDLSRGRAFDQASVN